MRGGTLVVEASEQTDGLLEVGFAALLPFLTTASEPVEPDLFDESVVMGNGEVLGGVLVSWNDHPVVVWRNLGLGSIVCSAVDPGSPVFANWDGPRGHVTRRIGRPRTGIGTPFGDDGPLFFDHDAGALVRRIPSWQERLFTASDTDGEYPDVTLRPLDESATRIAEIVNSWDVRLDTLTLIFANQTRREPTFLEPGDICRLCPTRRQATCSGHAPSRTISSRQGHAARLRFVGSLNYAHRRLIRYSESA